MAITVFWNNLTDLCNKNGIAPSVLAKELNLSPSTAARWKSGAIPKQSTLKAISEKFGVDATYLVTYHFKGNHFETPDFDNFREWVKKGTKIPVLGRVAAGIPIEQIVDIDGWEEISDELAKNGKYFALKIHGNSMEPRMCEKDTIIVRQQNTVENGEIAVVSVNGLDATCKKVEYTDDGISLISFNPAYAPMKFTKEQAEQLPITILGKVVELRAKM